MKGVHRNHFIPCLLYHSLSAETGKNVYTVSEFDFNAQLEFLSHRGYQAITVEDYLDLRRQGGTSYQFVLLTFDDGTKSDYDLALPLLKKYGYKATLFIIAGRVGQTGRLSWQNLKEMKSEGMSIQSHTFSHRILSGLSAEEIFIELSESKKVIESEIGPRVCHLSLPFGFGNKAVQAAARQVGYQAIWTSRFGVNRPGDNPFSLKRNVVRNSLTLKAFTNILQPNLIIFQKELVTRVARIAIKNTFGLNRYNKLKNFFSERPNV